ncbi:tetratricopeptide repeat protein [Candidatus Omnitrophota bacterium]
MKDGSSNIHMFRKSGPLKAIVCIVALWSFLLTNIGGGFLIEKAWAAGTPLELTTVGSNRAGSPGTIKELNVESFTLPQYLGHIKDVFKGAGDKTVIHIQDAHCNYAAQKRIADIIEYLNKECGVTIVNLEGGKGDYDLSIFTNIQDKDIRDKVADYFMEEGLVNGAEYFAINNPDKTTLWGVEDTKLYLKNLNIYRESLKHKEAIDKSLKELDHIISNLKRHIYSDELLELDAKYTQHKADKLEFKDYLTYLIKAATQKAIDVKSFTNVYLLSQSLIQEEGIDFRAANSERNKLIDEFEKMLSKRDFEKLVLKTIELKSERISQKDYYSYLVKKAKLMNFDLEKYPELQKYIVYISMYSTIDKTRITEEVDELENRLKTALYENEKQKELNALSRNLALTKNIFSISLLKEDYEYYKENKDSFSIKNYTTFIGREAPLYKVTAKLDRSIEDLDKYRENIAKFYDYSFKRDNEFIKNIKFSKKPSQISLLITGGFHTENLCDLFKKQDISYVSIMPNFKKGAGYESPYFSLLAGRGNGLQSKLYPAIASLYSMQIASMLSNAIAPVVWGRANIDAFRAAVLVRAQIAKGREISDITRDGNDVVFHMAGEATERMPIRALLDAVHKQGMDVGSETDEPAAAVPATEPATEPGTEKTGPDSGFGSIAALSGVAGLALFGSLARTSSTVWIVAGVALGVAAIGTISYRKIKKRQQAKQIVEKAYNQASGNPAAFGKLNGNDKRAIINAFLEFLKKGKISTKPLERAGLLLKKGNNQIKKFKQSIKRQTAKPAAELQTQRVPDTGRRTLIKGIIASVLLGVASIAILGKSEKQQCRPLKMVCFNDFESISKEIEKQIISLEYSAQDARAVIEMVGQWKNNKGQSFLLALSQRLSRARKKYNDGNITKHQLAAVEAIVATNLSQEIVKKIKFGRFVIRLPEIIQNRQANCSSYSALFFVISNALGISATTIEVSQYAKAVMTTPSPGIYTHAASLVALTDGRALIVDMAFGFSSENFDLEKTYKKSGDLWKLSAKPLKYQLLHKKFQIFSKKGMIASVICDTGTRYASAGQNKEAMRCFNKAINMYSRSPFPYLNRASSYASFGRYNEALADISRSIKLDPENAQAYWIRGDIYARMGNIDQAMLSVNKAIAMDPKIYAPFIIRGALYNKLGRYAEALADYDKAASIYDKDARLFFNRGRLYMGTKQYHKAITDFSKAIELNPKDMTTYHNRGTAYSMMSRHSDAIKDYTKAIQLAPRAADPYRNRGLAYANLGQLEKAKQDLLKALKLNPALIDVVKRASRKFGLGLDLNKIPYSYRKNPSLRGGIPGRAGKLARLIIMALPFIGIVLAGAKEASAASANGFIQAATQVAGMLGAWFMAGAIVTEAPDEMADRDFAIAESLGGAKVDTDITHDIIISNTQLQPGDRVVSKSGTERIIVKIDGKKVYFFVLRNGVINKSEIRDESSILNSLSRKIAMAYRLEASDEIVKHNIKHIFSKDFIKVRNSESIGGNVPDGACVNGVMNRNGALVASGNPQDVLREMPDMVDKQERGELYECGVIAAGWADTEGYRLAHISSYQRNQSVPSIAIQRFILSIAEADKIQRELTKPPATAIDGKFSEMSDQGLEDAYQDAISRGDYSLALAILKELIKHNKNMGGDKATRIMNRIFQCFTRLFLDKYGPLADSRKLFIQPSGEIDVNMLTELIKSRIDGWFTLATGMYLLRPDIEQALNSVTDKHTTFLEMNNLDVSSWIASDLWNKFTELNNEEPPEVINVYGDFEKTLNDLLKQLEGIPDEKFVCVLMHNDYTKRIDHTIAIDRAGHIKKRASKLWMGDVKLMEYEFLFCFSSYPALNVIHLHDISLGGREFAERLQGKGLMSKTFENVVTILRTHYLESDISAVAISDNAVVHWFKKYFNAKFATGKEVDKVESYVNVDSIDLDRVMIGKIKTPAKHATGVESRQKTTEESIGADLDFATIRENTLRRYLYLFRKNRDAAKGLRAAKLIAASINNNPNILRQKSPMSETELLDTFGRLGEYTGKNATKIIEAAGVDEDYTQIIAELDVELLLAGVQDLEDSHKTSEITHRGHKNTGIRNAPDVDPVAERVPDSEGVPSRKLVAHGDMHGELDGFKENLRAAGLINKNDNWAGGDAVLIQVGDVIDRGPKSREAFEFLRKLQKQAGKARGDVVRLLGNHELLLLQDHTRYLMDTLIRVEGVSMSEAVREIKKLRQKIKNDVLRGDIVGAYFANGRMFVHGGLRSKIREQLKDEITQKGIDRNSITEKNIVERINEVLMNAIQNDDFSHSIFDVDFERGGNAEVAGIFWTSFDASLAKSAWAGEIKQIVGHTPDRGRREGIGIRGTESMRRIDIDAGLLKHYGGNRAFLVMERGLIKAVEKTNGSYKERVIGKYEEEDSAPVVFIKSRQAQSVEAFNGANRKADTVKAVIGMPVAMGQAQVQQTIRKINRGLARNGFGDITDNHQVITFEIAVDNPDQTRQNYEKAVEKAHKELPKNGRVVLFAPQMGVGPQLAKEAREKYQKETHITVVPDAYTDSKPEQDKFTDIDVRVALARHIGFYYNGSDQTAAIKSINNLLRQVSEGYTAITRIDQLLSSILKIRPIVFESIVQWQRSQEATATAL